MTEEYRTAGGEGRGSPDTQRAAERYLRAGLKVIPVPTGEKNPNRPGWQNERHTVKDVPRFWNNGQGIGVLWGEPSGGLVDIDLDWTVARIAARHILPATRTFGRTSAPESHRVYRATGTIPKTKRYKIGGDGDGRSVVEVLSTGTQSLVPPSLHDSGERRAWHQERPVAEVDGKALMDGVADTATAALIARKWPGKGARHEYVLAATGYIGRRLPRERAERIMEAAVAASGDEEAVSRLRDVRDTLDNLDAGRPATGGPALDTITSGVVDQIRRWHGWGSGGSAEYTRQPDRSSANTPSFNLTDLGNAERLVAHHGGDLRYVHPWSKWLAWDGKRWAVDTTGEVERKAVVTVRSIYAEAANEPNDAKRKVIDDHARRSEARSRIEAMVALARSMPGIPVSPDDLDADPWLLNAENGTVDLRTGELREHRRDDLITRLAPVEYDPSAEAPRFTRFLNEIFDGDEDLIGFVQRFAGYSLTGSTEERCLAILHGRGKNGKSTLVELLEDVMGDYATTTDTETILAKRYQSVSNDVAALKGARFVATAEVEQGRALAESKVKSLTGSDTVTARFLYAEPFSFRPEFKLWLSTNNKPVIRGTDDAIWDRIRLIPFSKRFEGKVADPKLPEKLRAEMPGVLAWMVQGCIEWQPDGLGQPKKVAAATKGYRAEMDLLAAFIEDRCVEDPKAEVPATPLYKVYQEWCEDNGEAHESQRRFGGRLTERGLESFTYTSGAYKNRKGWRGIGLRDDHHDDDRGGGESPPGSSTGVNDQSRTNGINTIQDAHNAQDSTGEGLPSRQTVDDRLPGESPIDTGNATDSVELGRQSRRKNQQPSSTSLVKESSSKKGLPSSTSSTHTATPRGGRRLTADEAERVKQLIDQGMSAEWARAEVLGEDAT